MTNRTLLASLLFTTALSSSVLAAPAMAQTAASVASPAAARNPGGGGGANTDTIGEVVVTATKQSDTISRVPLSISATTQRGLDQQGIRNVSDLARSVPALTVSSANTQGVGSFTIRGITTGGSAGAATVGVYLDDTNVTKRQVTGPGGSINNNGSPLPALFDIERVEVLRGPQGTLYGGSSEGGTVRFITPTPSLTTYSTYDRATISNTDGGTASYDLGVAVGGPIIQDKLGFRLSLYGQHNGGWIDHVSPFTDQVTASNTNDGYAEGLHAALLWRPSENFSVLFSYFMNQDKSDDASTYNLPTGAITTPQLCTGYSGASAHPVSGGQAGLLVSCSNPSRPITYTYPSQTFGPYNLAPYQTLAPYTSPTKSYSQLPSLTLEYDFPKMTVKSITSYSHDQSKSLNIDTSLMTSLTGANNVPGCGNATTAATGAVAGCQASPGNPNGNPPAVITLRGLNGAEVPYYGAFKVDNERHGVSEEVRFSSNDAESPITWVGGVYYSYDNGKFQYINNEDYNLPGLVLYGLSTGQRFAEVNQDPSRGAIGALFPLAELSNETGAFRSQSLIDTEVAAFGDVNWKVTDKLHVLGGLRVSRVEFKFSQTLYGVNSGYNVPSTYNGGLVSGIQTESPILPKFGLQYQIDNSDQVYATASKGFRPGGVNSPISSTLCTGLAQAGLTPQDIPTTYNSDTVWSYEAGAKLRFFGNHVALNSSVYRIDWNNVQVAIPTTGCGQTYNLNAGQARSEGFDVDAQARLFGGLTLSVAAGYDDAKYTTSTTGPKPTSGAPATVVINAGDKLAVPPWTVSLGAEYDVHLPNGSMAYLRGDYRFTSSYQNTVSAGATGYAPDAFFNPEATNVNLRLGVLAGPLDVSLFVNNLFNSQDWLSIAGGRTGCNVTTGASCSMYSTYTPVDTVSSFMPRQIGLQVVYRR